MSAPQTPIYYKNVLGLGPNVTGLLLGGLFFGVYFGSSYLTRRRIMQISDDPQPAKYFRDLTVGQQGTSVPPKPS